jgi:hypothetical protein
MRNLARVGFSFLLLSFGFALAQSYSQDPGHKEKGEIAGTEFSVPNGFNLERSSDLKVAFMRHENIEHLALFVSVSEKQADDKYLTKFSNTLVSLLFPNEKDFRWKVLPSISGVKRSKYQTAAGNTKGFNQKKFFQIDYKILKVNNREIIVGYITKLGEDNEAKFLFSTDRPMGGSVLGWHAQAHIIASITGERYEEVNPPTTLRTAPATKSN